MRIIGRIAATVAFFAVGACGDDPVAPAPELGLLVGSWEAESFVFSSGPDSIDLVALGGAMTVDIDADGRVVVATREPGTSVFDTESGTVSIVRSGVMRLAVGDPVEVTYQVTATELRFSGPGSADIDGDGIDDPVSVSGVFVRRTP